MRNQNLIYFSIIDPQKFVCSSDPVGVIMFAFGTLFVDKLINRFIFRFVKDMVKYAYDHMEIIEQ